jgi:tetratricopeptide (TPR) repeat protein
LAPELASALGESGKVDEALELLEEASAAEEELTRARAAVTRSIVRQQPLAGRDAIREAFERAGDDYGLALYWWSVAWDAWSRVCCAETAVACQHALMCLARAGLERGRVADSVRVRLVTTYVFGPIHVDEAIARTEALIAEGTGEVALAWARVALGNLCAMRAEFDKARELVAGARQSYRDAGMLVVAGALAMHESRVEWKAGNLAAAERTLEEGLAQLEEIGDRGFHGTVALMLAELRYVRGRYDDARALCASARTTTETSDLFNFVLLDSIEGCLLAREGRLEEALWQCRSAIEHTSGMDGLEALAAPRRYLAEALCLAGQTDEARTVAAEAIAIREAKGDMTGAARTREALEQIGLAVS